MSATSDIHRIATTDGKLQVHCYHDGDRFVHQIRLGSEQIVAPESTESDALRSIEGTADDDWPPSPAIQQLSSETIDGQPMILGVGGSGTSHFSVSIQCIHADRKTKLGMQSSGIHFDWAARLSASGLEQWHERIQRGDSPLGSAYDGPKTFQITPLPPSQIQTYAVNDVPHRRVVPAPEPDSRTLRWAYIIRPVHG